ncbi:MAG: LPS export ABC transporter periplasmic protein LptC [Verrucomicrobiales bacterium]
MIPPTRTRTGAFVLLLSTALLPLRPAVQAQPEGKADESATAEDAVQAALPPELVEMFPVGREFKGIAIPTYTNDALQTVMRADSVIRVDEQFLDLLNLVISVYNGEGETETTITMDEAAYDLTLGKLTSKTPSKIEQPKFTMTGDRMIFETHSRISRLVGNVRLVVPDTDGLAPSFGLPASGDSE